MHGHHGAVLLNVWSTDQHPSLDSLSLVCDGATTESEIGRFNDQKMFTMLRTFRCFYKSKGSQQVGNFIKNKSFTNYKYCDRHFHKKLYNFIETIIAEKSC